MGLALKSRPRSHTTLGDPSYCVGLLLSPQILDKVLGGQHFSRSEDKQDWAGKIMGPDDLGPRQARDGDRQ